MQRKQPKHHHAKTSLCRRVTDIHIIRPFHFVHHQMTSTTASSALNVIILPQQQEEEQRTRTFCPNPAHDDDDEEEETSSSCVVVKHSFGAGQSASSSPQSSSARRQRRSSGLSTTTTTTNDNNHKTTMTCNDEPELLVEQEQRRRSSSRSSNSSRRRRSSSSNRGSSSTRYTQENVRQTFFAAVEKSLEKHVAGDATPPTEPHAVVHRPVAMRIARPTAQRIAAPSKQHRRSRSTQSLPNLGGTTTTTTTTTTMENVNPNISPTLPEQQNPATRASIPLTVTMVPIKDDHHHDSNNPNNWNNVPRRRKKKRSPEQKYQMIKASWYHSIAAKNRLGAIGEDPVVFSDSDREHERRRHYLSTPLSRLHMLSEQQVYAKRALLQSLNNSKGDLQTTAFQSALQQLLSLYDASQFDPRRRGGGPVGALGLEGVGISAGKPTFPGCIGHTANGDPMYKLGTMSFGTLQQSKGYVTKNVLLVLSINLPNYFLSFLRNNNNNRHVLSDTTRHERARNLCLD